jgi:hypothetical protein
MNRTKHLDNHPLLIRAISLDSLLSSIGRFMKRTQNSFLSSWVLGILNKQTHFFSVVLSVRSPKDCLPQKLYQGCLYVVRNAKQSQFIVFSLENQGLPKKQTQKIEQPVPTEGGSEIRHSLVRPVPTEGGWQNKANLNNYFIYNELVDFAEKYKTKPFLMRLP